MSKFERFVMKWLLRRLIHWNTFDASRNLKELYGVIRVHVEETYPEDNPPTIDAYLHDAFKKYP
jgi:hypothetical protein